MAMRGIAYFATETCTETGQRGSSRGLSPLQPIPQVQASLTSHQMSSPAGARWAKEGRQQQKDIRSTSTNDIWGRVVRLRLPADRRWRVSFSSFNQIFSLSAMDMDMTM
ncbi:hypothetical protein GGI43DRAFT_129102 [Trichoderma evansii]